MKVLIACEESQAICKAMRDNGHEAYSCDIRECSGGHPEWHIKGDCLEVINGNTGFFFAACLSSSRIRISNPRKIPNATLMASERIGQKHLTVTPLSEARHFLV